MDEHMKNVGKEIVDEMAPEAFNSEAHEMADGPDGVTGPIREAIKDQVKESSE